MKPGTLVSCLILISICICEQIFEKLINIYISVTLSSIPHFTCKLFYYDNTKIVVCVCGGGGVQNIGGVTSNGHHLIEERWGVTSDTVYTSCIASHFGGHPSIFNLLMQSLYIPSVIILCHHQFWGIWKWLAYMTEICGVLSQPHQSEYSCHN